MDWISVLNSLGTLFNIIFMIWHYWTSKIEDLELIIFEYFFTISILFNPVCGFLNFAKHIKRHSESIR
jgi:hypothetical protein